VQILVVVASIQMRSLNAEVEEVSVLTAFVHGLVGPKKQHNCVNVSRLQALGSRQVRASFERESGQNSRT